MAILKASDNMFFGVERLTGTVKTEELEIDFTLSRTQTRIGEHAGMMQSTLSIARRGKVYQKMFFL